MISFLIWYFTGVLLSFSMMLAGYPCWTHKIRWGKNIVLIGASLSSWICAAKCLYEVTSAVLKIGFKWQE